MFTVDLEEFERAQGEDRFRISSQGLSKLYRLLSKLKVPATFFTTATYAQRFPEIIQSISEHHEIALHALEHSDNYRTMEQGEAGRKLSRAKGILEEIIGKEVVGFRAPQMQAPEMKVLKEIGIRYDSSLHPTYVPGRYSHHRETMDIHDVDGVVRVPVSVTPRLRMAYSWFWFRVGGGWYSRMCTKATERKMDFVTIYFHPWDFVDLRKMDGLSYFYTRNTHRSLDMLETYLEWVEGRGYRFTTMGDYLQIK